jgi:8-oxo-dGTP pyrophosphatase MutT (NUDIX family)
MTDNPWTRLARRIAYENAWITVWHDDVLRPDGQPGVYGVVHYRNRAVGVVALDDEDRVLLVGQYRYTLDIYSWELPEGGAAPGEEPLAAAKRELREETGCTAAHWQELLRAHLSNSVSDEEAIVFLARGLADGPARPGPKARNGCRCGACRSPTRWPSWSAARSPIPCPSWGCSASRSCGVTGRESICNRHLGKVLSALASEFWRAGAHPPPQQRRIA